MGLISHVGQGIGVAIEYHGHRKQKKLSRENSMQEESRQSEAVPSSSTTHRQSRSLSHGSPSSGDTKKYEAERYDETDYEDDTVSIEDDEEDWELDEVFDQPSKSPGDSPPSYEASEAVALPNTEALVRDVMITSDASANIISHSMHRPRQPLPYPVILPQRRPRNKSRGFVRAYAPVLADCGIDQATFLTFLKNFHTSSQASPIFGVIQICAAIAGVAPSVIAMAVTTAVQVAAKAGAEVQSRQRTNNFLNRMNTELFQPAGLYAFIMKYKPDASGARSGISSETVDFSKTQIIANLQRSVSGGSFASGGGESSRGISGYMKGLSIAAGTTHGALELPEAAPLIFPAIDNAVAREGAEETFKDKAKDAKKFLADYLDRRAQAEYARSEPSGTNGLIVPEDRRSFKSNLADPWHPIYQGGLKGFVSGGALTPRQERRSERGRQHREARWEQQGEQWQEKQRRHGQPLAVRGQDGLLGQLGGRGNDGLVGALIGAATNKFTGGDGLADRHDGRSGQRAGSRQLRLGRDRVSGATSSATTDAKGPGGKVKRMMRQDVLYLMIVNMPSEAELAEARASLAA